ncbi:MAG: GAF domain-containing protein [Anaerolineales bacterium]|nr:GAF domain-containing protein [Anaerolineales bacterium]
MNTKIKVLFVEDSDGDAQLVLREIQRGGYEVEFERIETAEHMKSALTHHAWDLIICDFSLPQFSAPEALGILQVSALDIPFIIVSGTIGEETAINALKAGAHDFVIKGNLSRLVPAIQRELRDAKVRSEHAQRERELEAIATVGSTLRKAKTLDDMLSRLLVNTLEIVKVDSGSIWLYDEAVEEIKLTVQQGQNTKDGNTSFHSGDGIPGYVVQNRIGIVSSEFRSDPRLPEKNRTNLSKEVGGACIPLYSNEDIVGVILIYVNWPRELSAGEERIINALAEIGGNAIQRTQLLEQSIKQIDRLNSLRTIDVSIGSLDLQKALGVVLNEVVLQLKVDAAAILLLQPETNHLVYSAGRGFRTEVIQTTDLPVGKGHAGQAAQDKRIIFIKDLRTSNDSFSREKLREEEGFIAYYAVPLISKNIIKGVLEIFNRAPLHINMDWLNFLDILSWETAIGIDNSLLFESLRLSNLNLEMAYNATIEGWSHALDLRDKETEGHSLRVTEMALKLSSHFGMNDEQLINVQRGALLHDIGKMGVPDNILLKPGPLTEEEWEIMRKHPQFAYELLTPISYLHQALDIPYCHHEKWDGTGYPRGLKGEEIPLAARIFAVVDVWDALTSERPYRPAWSKEKAIEYIQTQSGVHFDPQVVEVFLKSIINSN